MGSMIAIEADEVGAKAEMTYAKRDKRYSFATIFRAFMGVVSCIVQKRYALDT